MTLKMHDSQLTTIHDLQQFLNASNGLVFTSQSRKETYQWVQATLVKLQYQRLHKPEKGIVRMYLGKMTGYSTPQVTRLIRQYGTTGRIVHRQKVRHQFAKIYNEHDIRLLAKTDALHDFPNGNAVRVILQRMVTRYGQIEYTAIAKISPAHIYNIRQTVTYKRLNARYTKTKPTVSNIGERRKPEPNGKPGYIRVDTVHQGDQDKEKGVYHINMVDEVTQFEFFSATEKISEAYLIGLLEALLDCFPFVVIEFHADNGSEYINYLVVELLNKLVVKLTKSRPRHSNDNALVEGKHNIIRKWLGYGFMAQRHADKINTVFYFSGFNEYLNYHRPCAFATIIVDNKGKEKKIYKPEDYMTPYDKLTSLPNWEQYLKPGVTKEQLQTIASKRSDNAMAQLVQQQRNKLLKEVLSIPAHSSR